MAAFWLIDFVIGLITFNPTDKTMAYIKNLILGVDLLWSFVLFTMHALTKVGRFLSDRIDLVYSMYDRIKKIVEAQEKENQELIEK